MKKIKFFILVNCCLFLTACVNQITSPTTALSLPKKIIFGDQTYIQTTYRGLDEMQHLLYLPNNKKINTKNWQQAILIFLDKNSQNKTLQKRLTLRENTFKQRPKTIANLQIINNELQSEIIYPPTQREKNIQLEISRGRNLACGFTQMQYAEKRSNFAKNLPNLTAYKKDLTKLAEQFKKLDWQIKCK